jgi:hypothetical protein
MVCWLYWLQDRRYDTHSSGDGNWFSIPQVSDRLQRNKLVRNNNQTKYNKMKKIIFCVMATFLSLTFLPLQLNAAATEKTSSLVAPKPEESAEAKSLLLRLDEIKATDMSKLNSSEKKTMRKEVHSIKRELREITGGVYLSVGAIILIVVLLIVLL